MAFHSCRKGCVSVPLRGNRRERSGVTLGEVTLPQVVSVPLRGNRRERIPAVVGFIHMPDSFRPLAG